MAYATDADLVARVAAAAAVDSDVRALALLDALQEIDDRVFGGLTLRAHVLLAAHYLQLGGFIAGGSGGLVSSRSAGEISVSYDTSGATSGPHSSTSYGQQFDVLADKAGHGPIVDSGDLWLADV